MRLGFFGGGVGVGGDGAAGEALRAAFASAGAVLLVGVDFDGDGGGAARRDAVVVVGPAATEDEGLAAGRDIDAFVRAGGPVLAIGAGVRVLCALGQLPGQVSARESPPVAPAVSHVRVEGRPTPFTSAIPAGRVLRLGAQLPGSLEWRLPDAPALAARGQIIFRACDAAGGTRRHDAIAGVSNERGNVVGLLAAPDIVGGEGEQLLRSLRLHLRAAR